MRILFFIASMRAGGAERQAALLCNAWSESGHDVTICTVRLRGSHYRLHEKVSLFTIRPSEAPKRGIIVHISDILRMRRAVQSHRPDVVVSFVEDTNLKVLLATNLMSVPVIVSERSVPKPLRGDSPLSVSDRFSSLLRRLLYPRASALIVQTSAVADWAKRQRLNARTVTIPNFLTDFSSSAAQTCNKTILAVGRLSVEKGHAILVEAFAKVASRHADWKLRLIGDGPLRPELEAAARWLGLESRIEFAGVKDVAAQDYADASIFVLPSRFEGFPNALVEAMSCGCAVIASNCPTAPREIICDRLDGLLFRSDDSNDLAQKLELLIRDEAERRALGARAREAVRRYDSTAVLPLWRDVLTMR